MRPEFSPTDEQIAAAEAVFLSMANLSLIKPIVREYQARILAEHQWTADPGLVGVEDTKQIVLNPDHNYLLRDEDSAVYFAECNRAREAAGLYVENEEYCPALVAEENLRLAKRNLVDAMATVTGMTSAQLSTAKLEVHEQFINLTLRLMAPYCRPKERLDALVSEFGSRVQAQPARPSF